MKRTLIASLLVAAACAPAVQQSAFYTPRGARLDDRTIATDLVRLDSVRTTAAAKPNGERTAMLVGLAREAYERNDDGTLTSALLADRVPRTVRPDLWAVLDSVATSPSASLKRDRLGALETALLRAQYDVLGAPSCKAWEAEAERVVAQLRIVPPAPAPASVIVPPVAPAPPPAPKAPATLRDVPTRVHFALNKHDLAPRTQQVLDQLVTAVAAFPEVTIVLEGNTDQRGSIPYNMALSDRRARSVRSYLTAHGIGESRITIKVLGKSKLESADNSIVQLARNRRVMIRYYAPDGSEIPAVSQVDDLQLEKKKP